MNDLDLMNLARQARRQAYCPYSGVSVGAALRRVPPRMERLAADSFTVYILHWPVMLGVRIVLRQLLGLSVPLTVAAMCAAGWLVPVAAAMLLRRLPLKRLRRPVKYLLGG